MRIAVMGAGAVGSYFGAKLAASGEDVSFIARGKHLEAMRLEGLKIKSPREDLHVRSGFTSDPEEVGPVDLVLFCVKSYDTEEAAKELAPLVGEKTALLSLQNGVDNADKVAAIWGKDRTLAGVVYIAARVLAPGTIEHIARGEIVLGELDGAVSAGTKAVAELFARAQVPSKISPEIRKVMWGKLVWNAPFCAISCLARATVREIVASDSLLRLAKDCMEEVREAAGSQGVHLSASIIEETISLSQALGDFKPSMLQDLEARKPLEHEAFNGTVVKLLRGAGKKAPVNETFYTTLKFLDHRIRAEGAR